MSDGMAWLIATGAATVVAVASWAIGRAQGVKVGRERTERRLSRRARRSVPGHVLEPRDRAESVTVVRYPEPLWPRPKEKTP